MNHLKPICVKKQPHFYRNFIISFLILTAILSASIMLFNFIIDPYDLHQTPKIEGLNKIKVEVEKQNRLYKAMEIARQRPKAILLGSSRVMGGFNSDDLTSMIGESTYNAGFGGASFEEVYHYFKHALNQQPDLKVAVIGLDSFSFSIHKKVQEDFSKERLNLLPTLLWKDVYASLFTKVALMGSYSTLIHNFNQTAVPVFMPHGQYNPFLLANENNLILAKGDLDFVKRMFSSSALYRHFKLDEKKIEMFREIVQICQKRSIRLEVFFCPSKAMYWEALYQKGLWPDLEELKRQVSTIHPFWDFSGFNCVTTQLEEKDKPFYFECSHFTPYLGKIVLEKMFNRSSFHLDFGHYITSENRETLLQDIRLQREKWIEKNSKLLEQIDQAIRSVQ
jgi:hypothetical protein